MSDTDRKRLRQLIEAAVSGLAEPSEQSELLRALAHDADARELYSKLEKEAALLTAAFAKDVELPAGLAAKVIAASRPVGKSLDECMVILQLREPDGKERVEKFERSVFTAGRGSEAELRVNDTDVSRLHCRFEFRDSRLHVLDLASRNGVILNEIKVNECDVEAGDIIRLGSTVIRVVQISSGGSVTGTGEITTSEELDLAYLVAVVDGVDKKFPLDKDVVTIGRGSEAEIRFDHEEFSRRHCCIERVFDEYQLVDLGSTNGTLLNDAPALMETLNDGDRVRIGTHEFIFRNPTQRARAAVAAAAAVVPVPVIDGAEAAVAVAPPAPRRPKIDPAVLEAKRARLQAQLEGKKETDQIVKWAFAAIAAVLLLVALAVVAIKYSGNSDKPKYNKVEAIAAANDIRALKDRGEYEKAIAKADQALSVFPPSSPEYRQIEADRRFSQQQLSGPKVDWKGIYAKAYGEFKSIKDRMAGSATDPIALDELFTEYKLWKARYAKLDEVIRRNSEPRPDFTTALNDAIRDSYNSMLVRSQLKAKDLYYGEAITSLDFYRKRYGEILEKYAPKKFEEYMGEIERRIQSYTADAKMDFEYNWDLAMFYIKENMTEEALSCLMLIIDRFGIPEYKKLAEEKLAQVQKGGGIPTRTDPTAALEPEKRYTEVGSDKLVLRYRFKEAVQYLNDLKSATTDDSLKQKIDTRLAEVQPMAEIFDWFTGTIVTGDTIDLGKGTAGKVVSCDLIQVVLQIGGGTITKKWESMRINELYDAIGIQAKRKAGFNNKMVFNLAILCLEFSLRREALTNMTKAYKSDETLKPQLDSLYARYSGKALPKDGFIVYKDKWLTPDEFQYAKFEEAVSEAVATLDSKDAAKRSAALDKLEELAKTDKNLVVSELTRRLTTIMEKIKASKVLKTLELIQDLRAQLNERRKEALQIIFDKNIYPDENHGAVGQPIVDEAVAKVREIYKTPIKGVIESDATLKDLVEQAYSIQVALRSIGYVMDDGMLDVDALLDAMNNEININSSLSANEQRIYSFSMKVKEYNELLIVPGKRTKEEKECVRHTNEYRLMMGKQFLRIDRRIVKAARLHSYDMATQGFFAHQNPNTGTNPGDRMKAAGYESPNGENIARGYFDAYGAFNGWYNSSGHHRNMLSGHQEIGLGVYDVFWTQNFGGGGVNAEDEPDNTEPIIDCGESVVDK